MSTRLAERVLGSVVVRNNDRIASAQPDEPNPRPLQQVAWHRELVREWATVRAEWDAFVADGGSLPLLDDLLGEPQGATEPWRAGLLVARGRTVDTYADRFPATISLVRQVPGVRSALWSVLAPGAVLPEHVGPNRGVLRYHLGVDCPRGAALRVGDHVVPYVDGGGVLFDDTALHEAWNRGDRDRVTLFLEVLRPLSPAGHRRNVAVQALLSQDPRYAGAVKRSRAWRRRLD